MSINHHIIKDKFKILKMNLQMNKMLKKISKLSTIKCMVTRSVLMLKVKWEHILSQIHIQELCHTINMIMHGHQSNLTCQMN